MGRWRYWSGWGGLPAGSRGKPDADAAPVRPESDNPLAQRRNPAALRSITGKQPSLGGPVMRVRKGWKKPGDSTDSDS